MSGLSFQWLRRGENREAGPLLSIRDLHVRVGIREVLRGINLDVYEGDHVLITGPNGCGKSTLLNAIMGVPPVHVTKGEIEFNGKNITKVPTHKRAGLGIVYMRQKDNFFPSLTVRDNIYLAAGQQGPRLLRELFPHWAKKLEMESIASILSGGQKQKLAYAMAVLRVDAVLKLLDEPRAGMYADDLPEIESGTVLEIEHNHKRNKSKTTNNSNLH